MPKTGGKKAARKSCEIESDVKLSDFANCSIRAGRLRKSVGSTLSKNAVDIKSLEEEERLWFERDLDEFQFLNINGEVQKKQQGTKTTPEESLNCPGFRYPIDVWYLIGRYIKPEDVNLFATVCKDSYQVSRSYSFWMDMYRRYFKPMDHLPTRLQPECIEQAFCLKSSVIRALYLMYPQFCSPLTGRLSSNVDVHELSNLCCTSMWRLQVNEKWVFHFKFQSPTRSSNTRITYRIAIKDLWGNPDVDGKKQDQYVNHNPDEGCKILKFTSSHFMVVPPMVIGSRLSGVRINLAHDMRRQKLQLLFCYSNYRQSDRSSNMGKDVGIYSDIVEFDAVENLMILNWWHPQYPLDYNV